MFMKGVLRAKGSAADQARRVFVADSFKGFPLAAEEDKRVDSDGWFHENSAFNVDGGGAEVRATFKRYGPSGVFCRSPCFDRMVDLCFSAACALPLSVCQGSGTTA